LSLSHWRQPSPFPQACKGTHWQTDGAHYLVGGHEQAGGNPEESSCPEEGSSRGQKEEKQRTGQQTPEGETGTTRQETVRNKGGWSSDCPLPSLLCHQHPGKDSTYSGWLSPPRGGAWIVFTVGVWAVVGSESGTPTLTLLYSWSLRHFKQVLLWS
jgi:hypothetical protein